MMVIGVLMKIMVQQLKAKMFIFMEELLKLLVTTAVPLLEETILEMEIMLQYMEDMLLQMEMVLELASVVEMDILGVVKEVQL